MAKAKQHKTKNSFPKELKCLKKAAQLTTEWARTEAINLLHIDLVAPAVLVNKKFSVWLFYASNAEIKLNEENGNTQKIKNVFISFLKELNCPEEYLSEILFFVDSNENVKRFTELKPIDE